MIAHAENSWKLQTSIVESFTSTTNCNCSRAEGTSHFTGLQCIIFWESSLWASWSVRHEVIDVIIHIPKRGEADWKRTGVPGAQATTCDSAFGNFISWILYIYVPQEMHELPAIQRRMLNAVVVMALCLGLRRMSDVGFSDWPWSHPVLVQLFTLWHC